MIRIFLILFFIPQLGNAQFNRAAFNIRGAGTTFVSVPRNDVILYTDFDGIVQTTVKTPQDASGRPTNGWNTRSGDYLNTNATPSSPFSNFQSSTTWAINKSTDTFSVAPSGLRLEVRKTDPIASGSVRAEIVPVDLTDTGDVWYGYAMYWQNWVVFPTSPAHTWQWHPTSGSGSAVLRLEIQGTNYQVIYGNSDSAEYYLDTGVPIVNNHWTNFVWHVKWSTFGSISPGGGRPAGNGTIEVWIDGVKVVNLVGNVRTDQKVGGSTGQYLKCGINAYGYTLVGNPGPDKRTFFLDEIRVARGPLANYNSVVPASGQIP